MLHIKKIKPLFTKVLTTGDRYEDDMYTKGIIVANKGELKLYQKVLAVGTTVRDIKIGDTVMINPNNYAVMKYDPNSIKNDMGMNKKTSWNLPWVIIDDENGKPKECLLLNDRDIEFIFEGEEKSEKIVVEDNKILLN